MDLFAFRFRDPLTGRWVSARYLATREQIADRYAEFEITGPAEVREGTRVGDLGASFPLRPSGTVIERPPLVCSNCRVLLSAVLTEPTEVRCPQCGFFIEIFNDYPR